MGVKRSQDRLFHILFFNLISRIVTIYLIFSLLQLFWEKGLENINLFKGEDDVEEEDLLPPSIKPIGPNVNSATALQVIKTKNHFIV